MRIPQDTPNRKILLRILAILIALAVIASLGLAFAYQRSIWPFSEKDTTNQKSTGYNENTNDFVDYSGPTEQEVSASQDAKKRGDQEQEAPQPEQPSTTNQVDVGISYAAISEGKLEIRAFTPSVIEGNGTCTATITKGSNKITATAKAFVDISSSICEPIYIDNNRLEAGTWNITVIYTSPTSSGTSNVVEVTR